MSTAVKLTKELKNPDEIGTHYRLVCMTGPNKGNVYYLIGKRIVVGRGNEVDIQVIDTKMSREHAEFAFSENFYTVTDLGAQNGIVVNDRKVKQKKLISGEKIVIGQTVFKYNVIKVLSSKEIALAEAHPESNLAQEIKKGNKIKTPVRNNKGQIEFEKNVQEVKVDPAKQNKSRVIIIGIVLVAVVFVLFGEDESTKKTTAKNSNDDQEIFVERVMPRRDLDDPEVRKKLDALIHSGRREFREGNYFRAMEEFRLALLLSPNNGQASYYLSKAKQRLDEDIQKNFEKGTQEQDSKKYQAAIISFCNVIQLIKDYPNDERYKNALIKLSSIESSLGIEKGEIKCFEEKPTDSGN